MRDRTQAATVGEADKKKKIGRFSVKRARFEITPPPLFLFFFFTKRSTSLPEIEKTIQTDNIAATHHLISFTVIRVALDSSAFVFFFCRLCCSTTNRK
jgi:hypothetical protein